MPRVEDNFFKAIFLSSTEDFFSSKYWVKMALMARDKFWETNFNLFRIWHVMFLAMEGTLASWFPLEEKCQAFIVICLHFFVTYGGQYGKQQYLVINCGIFLEFLAEIGGGHLYSHMLAVSSMCWTTKWYLRWIEIKRGKGFWFSLYFHYISQKDGILLNMWDY